MLKILGFSPPRSYGHTVELELKNMSKRKDKWILNWKIKFWIDLPSKNSVKSIIILVVPKFVGVWLHVAWEGQAKPRLLSKWSDFFNSLDVYVVCTNVTYETNFCAYTHLFGLNVKLHIFNKIVGGPLSSVPCSVGSPPLGRGNPITICFWIAVVVAECKFSQKF